MTLNRSPRRNFQAVRKKLKAPIRVGHSEGSTRDQEMLVRAVWLDSPPPVGGRPELEGALRVARRNGVEGRLARAYPKLLRSELARANERAAAFRGNLAESTRRLLGAGVQPVLIKASGDDYTYSNFDLVVGDEAWTRAIEALEGWGSRYSTHPAEPGKVLVHPDAGPAAHLHREVSWFGVPVISSQRLMSRSTRVEGETWWLAKPEDELRITFAHAAFQNLALELGELISVRDLLRPPTLEQARAEAKSEGWGHGFERVLAIAFAAKRRLDTGEALSLPVPLPLSGSLAIGLEHAAHLWRLRERRLAARETALRMPLIAAKRRRLLLGGRGAAAASR
jgi:hypothetical protein